MESLTPPCGTIRDAMRIMKNTSNNITCACGKLCPDADMRRMEMEFELFFSVPLVAGTIVFIKEIY